MPALFISPPGLRCSPAGLFAPASSSGPDAYHRLYGARRPVGSATWRSYSRASHTLAVNRRDTEAGVPLSLDHDDAELTKVSKALLYSYFDPRGQIGRLFKQISEAMVPADLLEGFRLWLRAQLGDSSGLDAAVLKRLAAAARLSPPPDKVRLPSLVKLEPLLAAVTKMVQESVKDASLPSRPRTVDDMEQLCALALILLKHAGDLGQKMQIVAEFHAGVSDTMPADVLRQAYQAYIDNSIGHLWCYRSLPLHYARFGNIYWNTEGKPMISNTMQRFLLPRRNPVESLTLDSVDSLVSTFDFATIAHLELMLGPETLFAIDSVTASPLLGDAGTVISLGETAKPRQSKGFSPKHGRGVPGVPPTSWDDKMRALNLPLLAQEETAWTARDLFDWRVRMLTFTQAFSYSACTHRFVYFGEQMGKNSPSTLPSKMPRRLCYVVPDSYTDADVLGARAVFLADWAFFLDPAAVVRGGVRPDPYKAASVNVSYKILTSSLPTRSQFLSMLSTADVADFLTATVCTLRPEPA